MWDLPAQPGTYIVEDAMGGGKTEAALGLAYHLMEAGVANGLYFALPTQTTSNRIYERVLDFLQRAGADVSEQSLRLAHGNSWLVQEDIFHGWQQINSVKNNEETPAGQHARNWFASSRRALLTRFGVGTIDQALMGEIAVKHSFVRRFGLAGKVVILDEVHSYDMYTGSLLDSLVHNLRELGASVIILSATLTPTRLQTLLKLPSDKGDFCAYPLVSIQAEQQPHQETALPADRERHILVNCRHLPEEEAVQLACQHAEQGQCVLWIRNTVAEAQQAYRLLCAERREDGPELGLLHARFPLWRRQELEDKWISRLGRDGSNRPKGCVLVSTQIAEQSLDIDADFLITDLAPTDMLLQRAGRLWRHERSHSERHAEAAELLILCPELPQKESTQQWKEALGASGVVYAPYVLLRSLELWQTLKRISLPADIRSLLNNTYEERAESSGSNMEAFLNDLRKRHGDMRAVARINQKKKDDIVPQNEGSASTRYITQPTRDILLLQKRPEMLTSSTFRYTPLQGTSFVIDRLSWDLTAARAIQKNIVRIPTNWVDKLPGNPPCYIANYGFSGVYALFPLDDSQPNCYLYNIYWTPELGIFQTQSIRPPHVENEF